VAKLKLSEFVLFAVLIYVGFMVSDWIAGALGLASWGLAGTLLILILPVTIIYYVWKQWLQKAAD
jgi:membrane protein DedA with SNARE-associated domain